MVNAVVDYINKYHKNAALNETIIINKRDILILCSTITATNKFTMSITRAFDQIP